MTIEFNKRVVRDRLGNVISDTSDLKIEDGKITGIAVENLKKDIIKSINNEIIKPENERIKQELEDIKVAISNNNGDLLKRALKKLIEKSIDRGVDVIIKIILAKTGIEIG
tara:strand:- start:31 stop:363 length:333 start_codon:yes stop_codon:yes gene_type:complete